MNTTFIDALEAQAEPTIDIFVGPPAAHFALFGKKYSYVTFCNGLLLSNEAAQGSFVGSEVPDIESKLMVYTVEQVLIRAKQCGASAIVLRRGTAEGQFKKLPAEFREGLYTPERVTYRVRVAFVI